MRRGLSFEADLEGGINDGEVFVRLLLEMLLYLFPLVACLVFLTT
jgi:hypothetical protein